MRHDFPRKGRRSVLFVFVVLVAGCRNHISINAPALPPTIKSDDYLIKPSKTTNSPYQDAVTAYGTAIVKGATLDLDAAKQQRNAIVYHLMEEIDKVYGEYSVRLNAGKGAEAFGFDFLTLGLSSAATIVTHAPTKTILSAIGTGITGTGQSFDKNYFSQQTFAVLAVAMQTRRDKVRASIVANLFQDDVPTYPLEAARRDLVAYYYAGTLAGGLQELQEESGKATAQTSASATVTAAPTFSPAGPGPFSSVQVTITDSTPGATIYYTTDGKPPTTTSSVYSSPVNINASLTLQAMAVATGLGASSIASAPYTISAEAPLAPAAVVPVPALTAPRSTPH